MRKALFAWLFGFQAAFGQIQPPDSLKNALAQAEGTTRVDILNQLTFELISRDNTQAMQFCDQALSLSKQIGYVKGEGLARAYKGVYEYLSGEFSDGRSNLRRGLQLAIKAHDRHNEGYCLLQLGNSYLDQAYLDSAHAFFMKADATLKDGTDPTTLAKVYRNLSMLHALKYELRERDDFMIRALEIRQRTGNKYYIANTLISLAGFRITDRKYKAADSILDLAENILKSTPTDRENLNDARYQRAFIFLRKRDFEEAVNLFDSARNYYLHAGLLQKFVTVQTNLGRTFYDRGEYETALKYLYEALRIAELKGFRIEIVDVRIQIGWAEFALGELRQSQLMVDSLSVLTEKIGLQSRVAEVLTMKGVILTETGNYSLARATLDKVLSIWNGLHHKSRIGEAYLNLGFLEEKKKNYKAAEELYQTSIALSTESDYDLGKAWSLLGLGSVYFQMNDYRRAEDYLNRAETIAKLIHSNAVLIRSYETRRDLLAKQNRFKESLKYSIASDQLKDSVQRSDLARRFANLAKIDEIERRDRNIKLLTQERELTREKIVLQDSTLRQQYILLIAGTIGIILLAGLVFLYARTNARIKRLVSSLNSTKVRIQKQADELLLANKQLNHLYTAVSDQKEEIQAQADELTKSYGQIRLLNQNLEKLIAEKTHDLQLTNEELVKQNNDLLQFSYTVSHNLRGPVARLLGLSDLIQNTSIGEEQKHFMGLVRKTSQDLDFILKDLSKIIDLRNDLNSTKEPVDLESEWLKCCDLLQESIREQFDITFDFSAAPQIITVKPIIQSIFYNLLSNAIKYRSPERALKVNASTRQAGDQAILEVSDNGLGMDVQKHRDSIFKLFKRFHTHVEGRGLGLFLIKSQISVLKGSIEVDSTVDRGTTFKVILPIRPN